MPELNMILSETNNYAFLLHALIYQPCELSIQVTRNDL